MTAENGRHAGTRADIHLAVGQGDRHVGVGLAADACCACCWTGGAGAGPVLATGAWVAGAVLLFTAAGDFDAALAGAAPLR